MKTISNSQYNQYQLEDLVDNILTISDDKEKQNTTINKNKINKINRVKSLLDKSDYTTLTIQNMNFIMNEEYVSLYLKHMLTVTKTVVVVYKKCIILINDYGVLKLKLNLSEMLFLLKNIKYETTKIYNNINTPTFLNTQLKCKLFVKNKGKILYQYRVINFDYKQNHQVYLYENNCLKITDYVLDISEATTY